MQYLLIGHVHPFAAVSSLAINILPHYQRNVKYWWGNPEQAKFCGCGLIQPFIQPEELLLWPYMGMG